MENRIPEEISLTHGKESGLLSTEDYARQVIQAMNHSLLPDHRLGIKFSETMAGILADGYLLFTFSLPWLESFRQVNAKGLEELILIRLEDRGIQLDRNSAYLKTWFRSQRPTKGPIK
ncbi:hypothetical protein [Candidatus Formimonas warabiya]|uniref:hypothetical protein n=1 Tax=Formimonas warabiya TaxID=1761012 RepID=UPI0011D0D8A2|nr:hypothetical protein [Candidatus Formimonas warabiya]